ncbi:MAG TPA: hypothetical protein PL124_07150 [Candidatus Cloacimonadota bacterium]|nr:hypothetical protein [Candidatus Cloacimonadota bacterium]
MKYMPILPIGMSHLFDICRVTDAFILPQFWGETDYREMYTKRSWQTVIIDNAMYENPDPVPTDELIKIAKTLNAHRIFIVAPEDHSDPIHTAEFARDMYERKYKPGCGWLPMTIVHGDLPEIHVMSDLLDPLPDMGFGIAVSTWRNGLSRPRIKEMFSPYHYFHAMGLDSIPELSTLSRAGFNSVDSSMVATAAVNKIHLDENTEIIRTGSPTDPKRVPLLQDSFEIMCSELTERNIDKMSRWI